MDLAVLHLVKHVRTVLVIARQRLVLQLAVLQVHDLLQVEDVIHALQNIPDELLLVLDLHRGVGHQQGIRNGHVDPLDLVVVAVGVVLIAAAAGAADVEGGLLVWGHSMVLVQAIVLCHTAASSAVLVAIVKVDVSWVYYALLEVVGVYLVGAASLAIQVRAVIAMRLARVIHVNVDAHFVAAAVLRRMTLLRRLRWLGI